MRIRIRFCSPGSGIRMAGNADPDPGARKLIKINKSTWPWGMIRLWRRVAIPVRQPSQGLRIRLPDFYAFKIMFLPLSKLTFFVMALTRIQMRISLAPWIRNRIEVKCGSVTLFQVKQRLRYKLMQWADVLSCLQECIKMFDAGISAVPEEGDPVRYRTEMPMPAALDSMPTPSYANAPISCSPVAQVAEMRDWNFNELLRNKLGFTWGWANVLSMIAVFNHWTGWPDL
jgi:hypothetical protein